MGTATGVPRRAVDLAAIAIVIVGLQQGLVPLGLRLVIGHRERFALASYLPPPWWWITCLVVAVAATALFLRVDAARRDDAGPSPAAAGAGDDGVEGAADRASVASSSDSAESAASEGWDAVSGFVLLAGIYNGVVPFVARVFDAQLLLAFPARLNAPWWWIVWSAACVATIALLSWLGRTRPAGSDQE